MKPRITLPELQDNGRRAYRLEVTPDDPIQVLIDGVAIELRNLSATGMAFISHQPLTDTLIPAQIKFRMEEHNVHFDCTLKLVRKVGQVWCADFEDTKPVEQKLLSRFITYCQTRSIRHDNKL